MSDPTSASPLTPVVFHILLALHDGPLHGYAVMKAVEQDSGLRMGPGTVYGSLQRLQDAGWVAVGERDAADRRRGRLFEMTPPGRDALEGEARRITRLAQRSEVRRLVADEGA